MRNRTVLFLAAGATCLMLASGCADNGAQAPGPSPSLSSPSAASPGSPSPSGSATPTATSTDTAIRDVVSDPPASSWQDALAAARKDFSGDVSKIELRQDAGHLEYRIELLNADAQYTARFDAQNLKRLSAERKELGAGAVRQRQRTFDPGSYIPVKDAAAAARRMRSGTIASWKLEGRETGRVEYEVGILSPGSTAKRNVRLNAEDGTVIAVS